MSLLEIYGRSVAVLLLVFGVAGASTLALMWLPLWSVALAAAFLFPIVVALCAWLLPE